MCWFFSISILTAAMAFAQTPPSSKFEAASIRPCKMVEGQRGGGGNSSPGRLNIQCAPLKGLINQAYLLFENGHFRIGLPPPIEGGPAWINSEAYEINARAEGAVALETMNGPLLQKLLEDRFQLKVHRETRQAPVYALTVAKGGPSFGRSWREAARLRIARSSRRFMRYRLRSKRRKTVTPPGEGTEESSRWTRRG